MKELSEQERRRLWLRIGARLALAFLGGWFVVRLGPVLISLFAPFLFAFPMAWLLSPAAGWLHKRLHWPRKLLVLLLLAAAFAFLFALLWGLTAGIIREIAELAKNWEALLASLQETIDSLRAGLSRLPELLPLSARTTADALVGQVFQWLETAIPHMFHAAANVLTDAVRGLPGFAAAVLVFVLASYFLAADWPSLRLRMAKWVPEGPLFFLCQVRRAFRVGFGGYIKAQFILSAGVFLILLAGFSITREPYAILLAFLFALIDFIPLLGAGTVMVPWAVLELLTGSIRHGVGLLIVLGVVALFRRAAEPRVLGAQTGLSPVVSLASVYAGMRLAGVMGMLLAPVVCLAAINVTRAGVFDNVWRDVRLAAGDLAALLSPEKPEEAK